ncbi:MAG: RNA-binding cell elongation regulator Jag/EloR [Bacillota bacterium]|nr:RNA-binding cell elongation regulator Jag/EloR [Bacillota bacterium]
MTLKKPERSSEKSAKTLEEAVKLCAEELGVPKAELEIEVIDEGSRGFLGIGGRDAVVRATAKINIEKIAADFLDGVVKPMGLSVTYKMKYENNFLSVEILGEDMGVLIGRRGETLDSIQYLTSLVVNKYTADYTKVFIDTENYKSKRQETLCKLAKRLASQVIRTRREVTLEPMNPNERRIIHSALQTNKLVYTYSVGDEPNRKVVISLKELKKD